MLKPSMEDPLLEHQRHCVLELLDELPASLRKFFSGHYAEHLGCQQLQAVFSNSCSDAVQLSTRLQTCVLAALEQSGGGSALQLCKHELIAAAVASLQLFVQSNFTGPVHKVPKFLDVFSAFRKDGQDEAKFTKSCRDFISDDTAGIYGLLNNPEYLIIPKVVFDILSEKFSSVALVDWWRVRYLNVLQTICDEVSTAFYDTILELIPKIQQTVLVHNSDLTVLFNLELTQMQLLFGNTSSAAKMMQAVEKNSSFNFELSGSFGKRTKFQVNALPQLLVTVNYKQKAITDGRENQPVAKELPENIELVEETRLPAIQFTDEDDDKVPNLVSLEQNAILTKINVLKMSSASEVMLKQQSQAYLSALLQHPKCWTIQFNALRLRALYEKEESRAVERALQQYEKLVQCVNEGSEAFERLYLFYSCGQQPFWEVKQEYAKVLVSLGMTKSALEIFEKLQLWENLIECYNILQMRQRSAEVIKEELQKEESPKLYCLLGDATDDISCYEKAWQMSNKKSSRAQKALADHYYHRKEFPEAVEHYKLSVALNHIQQNAWERMAYALLQLEDWEGCRSAYKQCVVLEPDSFMYWNNLSQCHVKLGDLECSWVSAREASRCKSDCWKTLENKITIGVSTGHYVESMFAYKRLLTFKPRHINDLTLSKLVEHVVTAEESGETISASYYKSLVQFFAEFCQKCPSESNLWLYYGEVVSCAPEPTAETRQSACQHLRKSLASATRDGKWARDTEIRKTVLQKLFRLEKEFQATRVDSSGPQRAVALASARSVTMLFGNVVSMATKGATDVATGEVIEGCEEELKEAQACLVRLKALVASLSVEA